MNQRFNRCIWFICVMITVWLTACSQQPATPISQPTQPPVQTKEAAQRPLAMAAPTQPIPTTTHSPTPPPTETVAPTDTPQPEPTAVSLTTAADFGPDRNIFTGEQVADPAVLQRRPIACKLSNFPAHFTRPQSGLNSADLLFEHVTEGRLTRFTAIFYSHIPPNIGPIRSARLVDLELPAMYDTALCYSGASNGVSEKLFSSDFVGRILRANVSGYYRTGEDKPFEHTLYARPEGLWAELDTREINVPPQPANVMPFTAEPPAGGESATAIYLDYLSEDVEWRYDDENGRYWRWSDGVPHLDANTEEQVNFRNVVVAFAVTVEDGSICEQITNGVCTSLSLEIQLWGEGRAVVFRDGLLYEAIWRRAGRNDMLTFYDAAGTSIPLQIGNTMFQLVPAHRTDQLQTEAAPP